MGLGFHDDGQNEGFFLDLGCSYRLPILDFLSGA